MRRRTSQNDNGVTSLVEYILTFTIASILFTIVLVMANSMFIDGPQRTVSRVQFTDIGNDLTAKVVDTYLIVPDPGVSKTFDISTKFDIPSTVAGNSYMADIEGIAGTDDNEVSIFSMTNGIYVNVTLNGINPTIPVNGNTSSMGATHRIYYRRT
jgi:hypothetical protein